jgi:hypothetical protein
LSAVRPFFVGERHAGCKGCSLGANMANEAKTVELQGIRALVEAVDRELTLLRTEHRDASAALAESWAALVRWLALSPAPKTRACTTCGKTIMLDATICGYCWTHMPLPD